MVSSWSLGDARHSVLPELQNTVIVAAFEGWNDAGDAASDALERLEAARRALPRAPRGDRN